MVSRAELTAQIQVSPLEFLGRMLARRFMPFLRDLGTRNLSNPPRLAAIASDHIGMIITAEGIYERDEVLLLRALLGISKREGVMIDVGANIGNHTIALADHFEKVIAYEPHPVTAHLLRANIALSEHQHINVRAVGLGDQAVTTVIRTLERNNLGSARISDNANVPGDVVEVRTADEDLADCLGPSDRVRFVKLDVEGHECNVIRGMRKTLLQHRPIVAFESMDGHAFLSITNELHSAGYTRFLTMSHGSMRSRIGRFLTRLFTGYSVTLTEPMHPPKEFESLVLAMNDRAIDSDASTR